MINVYIFGLSGRMGQEVADIINKSSDFNLLGGYSRSNSSLELGDLPSPDLVIDFSLPAAFEDLCLFIKKHKPSVVSGTTGLTSAQLSQLKDLGGQTPIFWAANMSFGVFLMSQLTKTLARYDQLYKYHVEETHHIHKKDKPSGTAIIIENAAKASTPNLGETLSIREGEVFGIHQFIAQSKNEKIEIKHEALNRSLFAQGAVDVGRWLTTQKAGFYGMDDFFGHLNQKKP